MEGVSFNNYGKELNMITLAKIEEILNKKKMLLEFFKKLEECLKAIGEIRIIAREFKKEDIKDLMDQFAFDQDYPRILANCSGVERNPGGLIPWDETDAIIYGLERIRKFELKENRVLLSEEKEKTLNESVKVASDFIRGFLREANGIWVRMYKPEKIKKQAVFELFKKWLKDHEQKQ
jgi:hypothetical protein